LDINVTTTVLEGYVFKLNVVGSLQGYAFMLQFSKVTSFATHKSSLLYEKSRAEIRISSAGNRPNVSGAGYKKPSLVVTIHFRSMQRGDRQHHSLQLSS
jgi:hypothetical protein